MIEAYKERIPHYCHAIDCYVEVPPKMLMCKLHWYKVPVRIRRLIWLYYVPGQEVRKDPTSQYLKVMQMAIDAVAEKEGKLSKGKNKKKAKDKSPAQQTLKEKRQKKFEKKANKK